MPAGVTKRMASPGPTAGALRVIRSTARSGAIFNIDGGVMAGRN